MEFWHFEKTILEAKRKIEPKIIKSGSEASLQSSPKWVMTVDIAPDIFLIRGKRIKL